MHTRATLRATLLGLTLAASAAATAQNVSPSPTFAADTPLDLRISGPFSEIGRDGDERPEHDAVLEYTAASGDSVALDIEIRVRGKSRLANCDFPPLSLDFQRDAVDGTLFAGQNRLKLVTLCKQSTLYRDYLVSEFLIYRMLNLLTDRSFRVRWATVEYVYTDTRRPRSVMAPAFLIEEDWEVAERLGMQAVEVDGLQIASLNPEHMTLFALFQYLIGNTDWSVLDGPSGESCCHNGKTLVTAEGNYVVLPYDFDTSGLIDAEYAAPAANLPIRAVTQRLWRGFCSMNSEIDAAISRANGVRERMLGLLDDERLSSRGRRVSQRFLTESFELLNDPDTRGSQIDERCRG